MRTLSSCVFLLTASALVLGTAGTAQAARWTSVFSVPFTCGSSTTSTGALLAGDYATTVLITNPDAWEADVTTRVSFTSPDGSLVSEAVDVMLAPGASIQVGCDEILGSSYVFPETPSTAPVTQGVLLVESLSPLSVSAVSTSATGGDVSSDVTQIAPSKRRWFWRERKENKAQICHVPPGNPSNARTLWVGESSVPAHLAHGDSRGACPTR